MKNVRSLLFLAVAVVILGGVAGVTIAKRQAARDAASQAVKVAEADLAQARSEARSAAAPVEAPVAPATAVEEVPQEASVPLESTKPVKATGQTNSSTQKPAAQANPGGPPVKEPLRDPVARVALAFVGMDADAEAYWYGAINNPSLPANERQDLIEDLNEEGLSDPRHPTAGDLPLIVSRLRIIEEVGPDAMDGVNADAFLEAYKDLANLANVALGGGQPVR
jgi:hypothetical protein